MWASAALRTLFQFTPLREGRLALHDCDHKIFHEFQFTPLREGRHICQEYADKHNIFQFTPLREGRQRAIMALTVWQYFNSRPCGRGDACPRNQKYALPNFNSRPCGRGDGSLREVAAMGHNISIHAPAGGATKASNVKFCKLLFQFTPLREGRPNSAHRTTAPKLFQFTPLREGRQKPRRNYWKKPKRFQFTPLREGRQQKGTKKENDYCTFCRKKRKVYLIIKRIRKNHQNPTAHIVQKFTPTLRRHAG